MTDATVGATGARDRQAPLMLVSARVGGARRTDAEAGVQPWPEYLVLEHDHGVRLVDWSQVRGEPSRRGGRVAASHVLVALRTGWSSSGFLSDGEHVGLPLAAALALRPRRPRHVMIAHHLNTPAKQRLLSLPRVGAGVDAFVVHSSSQVEALTGTLGMPRDRVHLVRYGVDTQYWSPGDGQASRLVVSPGREHRDHVTLAEAVAGLDAEVFVTDGSSHSPAAHRRVPETWPANIERGALPLSELREKCRQAAVIVVPLVETDFPAGITVICEAMAMGKAVVATGTYGLRGAVADQDALVIVPPGDPSAMTAAIQRLLDSPELRAELGARARRVAVEHHDVRRFAADLAGLLVPSGGANG